MRLLGIDYGDKKMGLAIADTDTQIAVPFDVLLNDDETMNELMRLVKAEDIDKIVVGVPLATGGHHGPEQLEKTRKFIDHVKGHVEVPVEEEDESYTTAESIRLQIEEGSEAEEDALAAMLILRGYLETHGNTPQS